MVAPTKEPPEKLEATTAIADVDVVVVVVQLYAVREKSGRIMIRLSRTEACSDDGHNAALCWR